MAKRSNGMSLSPAGLRGSYVQHQSLTQRTTESRQRLYSMACRNGSELWRDVSTSLRCRLDENSMTECYHLAESHFYNCPCFLILCVVPVHQPTGRRCSVVSIAQAVTTILSRCISPSAGVVTLFTGTQRVCQVWSRLRKSASRSSSNSNSMSRCISPPAGVVHGSGSGRHLAILCGTDDPADLSDRPLSAAASREAVAVQLPANL